MPGVGGRTPPWLALFVDALSAEAFHGGPGSDLVMARLSDGLLARALRHHGDTAEQPGWLLGLRDPYVAAGLNAMHTDPARPWTTSPTSRSRPPSNARPGAHRAPTGALPPNSPW